MRTLALILTEAGTLDPGFHLHIDNPPWMPLDIEDILTSGPNGQPTISVAHYGKQNGDPMRDPEMLFEVCRDGSEFAFDPYYWRNDYLGIERYPRRVVDVKMEAGFLLPGLHQNERQGVHQATSASAMLIPATSSTSKARRMVDAVRWTTSRLSARSDALPW